MSRTATETTATLSRRPGTAVRTVGRWALGASLLGAGTGHLTALRQEFQAQVPAWVPLDPDFVVLASGIVELGLGTALICSPTRFRPAVGGMTAAFFIAVFPGNISQYVTGTDAFGLDTDRARFIRLFFQPAFVAWALWSTGGLARVAQPGRLSGLTTTAPHCR